jgi:hypothetical protein
MTRPDRDREEEIRQFVEEKFKARSDMYTTFGIFVLVSIMLWAIWGLTSFGGFPWPFIPMMGFVIAAWAMISDYYSKYGGGHARRERMVQREIERERERLGLDVKQKNEDLFFEDYAEDDPLYDEDRR